MRQHRVNQYNLQKICQQDIPEIHILTISHIKFESKKGNRSLLVMLIMLYITSWLSECTEKRENTR